MSLFFSQGHGVLSVCLLSLTPEERMRCAYWFSSTPEHYELIHIFCASMVEYVGSLWWPRANGVCMLLSVYHLYLSMTLTMTSKNVHLPPRNLSGLF